MPTSYNAMLQVKDAESKYDLSSIRLGISAGEALPGNVYKQWKERFGVEILDGLARQRSCISMSATGLASPDPTPQENSTRVYEAKIVDSDGNALRR